MVNPASLDLNRLLVLHAVLETRSVTRAAARLHVTPSAVSNTLAQLRDTFADALVVRSGRNLVLTPRAAELAPRLAEAVAAVTRVLESPPAFAPEQSTRTFSLACSDAEQIAEVPRIAEMFARKLPRATLRILSVDQLEASGGLAAGGVDVAIAPAGPGSHPPPRGFHVRPLYREEGVLMVRRGHPRVRRKVTRELFNSLRHIDILLALGRGGIGHGVVEEYLASHGLRRDIAVTVPTFAAAAAIAAQTDWIAGMPRRVATVVARQLPLVMVEPPTPAVAFHMQLVWHDRTDADAGARFFRTVIVGAVAGRNGGASGPSRR
ncbi:MAG: LysR family transcriptional regulator [Myxococcota bacterium]